MISNNALEFQFEINPIKYANGSCRLQYGQSIIICSIQGPQPITIAGLGTGNSYNTSLHCHVTYSSHLLNSNNQHILSEYELISAIQIENAIIPIIQEIPLKCEIHFYINILQTSMNTNTIDSVTCHGLGKDISAMINCCMISLLLSNIPIINIITSVFYQSTNYSISLSCISYHHSNKENELSEITQLYCNGKISSLDLEYIKLLRQLIKKCQELKERIEQDVSSYYKTLIN